MIQTIKTKSGNYHFEPIDFHGRKEIDKKVALENLFDIADVLEKHSIRYGLIYGTLLGAFRDGDFIEWDTDVDLFVLDEDRQTFLRALFEFKEENLQVVRYVEDLISLMRDDDYVDLYFFSKSFFGKRVCGSDVLDEKFFMDFQMIDFHGRKIPCLGWTEEFLVNVYGQDWQMPIPNKPADARGKATKLKDFLRPHIPKILLSYFRAFKSIFRVR